MAGIATPSPMPMHARAASSTGSPICAAKGVAMVAIDHQTTPKPRMRLPPNLSAHTPPATWVSRYPLRQMQQHVGEPAQLRTAATQCRNLASIAGSRGKGVSMPGRSSLMLIPSCYEQIGLRQGYGHKHC